MKQRFLDESRKTASLNPSMNTSITGNEIKIPPLEETNEMVIIAEY